MPKTPEQIFAQLQADMKEFEATPRQRSTKNNTGIISFLDTEDITTQTQAPAQPEMVSTPYSNDTGFNDNALYDFIGNLAWGAAEGLSMGTLSVADMTGDSGSFARSMGSDPWGEESWAGKVGYSIGSGASMLVGLGLFGKGFQGTAKGLQIGSKAMTKTATGEIIENVAKHFGQADDITNAVSKFVNDDFIKSGWKSIDAAKKAAKAETSVFTPARRAAKVSPYGNKAGQEAVEHHFRKRITDELGDLAGDNVEDILKETMKAVTTNQLGNLSKTLAVKMGNGKAAQVAGAALYEATLLGMYDTIGGEVRNLTADYLDLGEEDYEFKDWYSNALHGVVVGGLLGPARFLPGGKAVQFGKSGMVADGKAILSALYYRMKPAASLNPKNMQTALRTMFSSGSKIDASVMATLRSSAPELTDDMLTNAWVTMSKADQAIATKAFRQIWKGMRAELPKLVPVMMKEIAEDGMKSFTRAMVGATIMNGSGYYEAYKQGILGTEDYPIDKLIYDQWIGMLWAKRGHRFAGKDPMPQWYAATKTRANSQEFVHTMKTLEMMGVKASSWDNVALAFAEHDTFQQVRRKINSEAVQAELKTASDIVNSKLTSKEEYVKSLGVADQGEKRTWMEWMRDEQGVHPLDAEANRIIEEQILVASELERAVTRGQVTHELIKPMTKEEAMQYVAELTTSRIKDHKLNAQNVTDLIEEARFDAVSKVTRDINDVMRNYIKDSLKALGREVDVDDSGNLVMPESMYRMLTDMIARRETHREATVLREAMKIAEKSGLLKRGTGRAYDSQTEGQILTDPEFNKAFKNVFNQHTEALHQRVFGTKDSSWRDNIVGYREKDTEFYDFNILKSTPIWHAIQTHKLHVRNRNAYRMMSGKGEGNEAELLGQLRKLYNNSSKLKIAADEVVDQDTMDFIARMNKAYQLFHVKGDRGAVALDKGGIEHVESIKKSLEGEFGDIFSSERYFQEFMASGLDQYARETLAKATPGLRNIFATILNSENMIEMRGLVTHSNGKILMLDSSAIEQLVSRDGPLDAKTRKEIDSYRDNIEIPLREGQRNGAQMIEFRGEIPNFLEPMELMNTIIGLNQSTDANRLRRIGQVAEAISGLGTEVERITLSSKQWKEDASTSTMRNHLVELAEVTGRIQHTIEWMVATGDAIGLRTLETRLGQLEALKSKLSRYEGIKAEPLKEALMEAELIMNGSLEKYMEETRLDEYYEVPEWIDDHYGANGRPIHTRPWSSHSSTISESAFIAKYSDYGVTPEGFASLTEKVQYAIGKGRVAYDRDNAANQLFFNEKTKEYVEAADIVESIIFPFVEDMAGRMGGNSRPDFHSDVMQIIMNQINRKQMLTLSYNAPDRTGQNGTFNAGMTVTSRWHRGINRLQHQLGLTDFDGSIMMLGQQAVIGERQLRGLDKGLRDAIAINAAKGMGIDIPLDQFMDVESSQILERLQSTLVGDGKGNKPQFRVLELDDRTTIVMSARGLRTAGEVWKNPESRIRKQLSALVDSPELVDRYFENIGFDKNGKNGLEVLEKLVYLTRAIDAVPHEVQAMFIERTATPEKIAKLLKYAKLDNARNGLALDKTTVEVTERYWDKYAGEDKEMLNILKHFKSQMVKNKHMRTIEIEDEDGQGEKFFSIYQRGKAQLKQQLIDNGYSIENADAMLEIQMQNYQTADASVVNGEWYLSLPHMAALLLTRGGSKDWFTFNEKGEVTGFQAVIKPTVMNSEFGEDGSVSVQVGKTAFKFNPMMDAMMKNPDGKTYKTDSITFSSAMKINKTKAGKGQQFLDKRLRITPAETDNSFKNPGEGLMDLVDPMARAGKDLITMIPNEAILLKSISTDHDGTLTAAFGNHLSNEGQKALNDMTGSLGAVSDLLRSYKDMHSNPLSFRSSMATLRNSALNRGDLFARSMGIEGVLEAGGVPVFEYMIPQADKMLVSEYLGNRNFTTSRTPYGGYNVMTAATDLSMPLRIIEGGSGQGYQRMFGGSGKAYREHQETFVGGIKGMGDKQGVSLILTLTPEKAAEMNAILGEYGSKKDMSFEPLKSGDDIVVTHDGFVMGPHLTAMRQKAGDKIFGSAKRQAVGRELDARINGAFKKAYADALEGFEGMNIADLVAHLDGEYWEGTELQGQDYKSNGGRMAAKKTGFKAIHVANVDLRTPMAGMSDRVITKVEKLLSAKRGPVSEMNYLDVVDPQDADFDLDKSASFFALPGAVVRDIYNLSGYQDVATGKLFDTAMKSVLADNSSDMTTKNAYIAHLEGMRGGIVRQHSAATMIYNMLVSRAGLDGIEPGLARSYEVNEKGGVSHAVVNDGIEMFNDHVNRSKDRFRVTFKDGGEYINSLAYLKNLIKTTIDVYKATPEVPSEFSASKAIWFGDNGFLKIERRDQELGWIDAREESTGRTLQKEMTELMIPLGQFFNLQNMTETMANGTQRKMGVTELVSSYNDVIRKVQNHANFTDRNTGAKLNHTAGIAENLLEWLGATSTGKQSTSNHPLAQGMKELAGYFNREINGKKPATDATITNMLSGEFNYDRQTMTSALNTYIRTESDWAQMGWISYEAQRINDRLEEMRHFKQTNTSKYDRLLKVMKAHTEAIGIINEKLNGRVEARGTMITNPESENRLFHKVAHIYTIKNNEVVNFRRVSKGKREWLNKGDVVIYNPRELQVEHDVVLKSRRAFAKAFARDLPSLEYSGTRDRINDIAERMPEELFEVSLLNDRFAPMSSDKWGTVSELQQHVLARHMGRAHEIAGADGVKQLLFRLLTPVIDNKKMAVTGYDPANGQYITHEAYRSNRHNEKLVLATLDKMMAGKGSDLIHPDLARDLHSDIIQRMTVELLRQNNPTIMGDVMAQRRLEDVRRPLKIFQLTKEEIPIWMTHENIKDELAADLMAAYMNGTYHLDPIELYHLTENVVGGRNLRPSDSQIAESVASIWGSKEQRTISAARAIHEDTPAVRDAGKHAGGYGEGTEVSLKDKLTKEYSHLYEKGCE
ncbi:MAG: hypothetical protein HN932_13035 [Candidatus Marinimicrobia bacterium]|jgi:hypothetical protein|nr:hypothetical protein [Candidatus Neomarinimicrobiota bacterium]